MNRLLILFTSFLLICCQEQQEKFANGLTKEAIQITEYIIKIKENSNAEIKQDTLSITSKFYNNNQILKRVQTTPFNNQTMETNFVYDDFGKVQKEIVKMDFDNSSFEIDYFYKDSLLIKTQVVDEVQENVRFKQIENYTYSNEGIKLETETTQEYIDFNTNDTLVNMISLSKFNDAELVSEIETINYKNPLLNSKRKYEYENELVKRQKVYDSEDSLTSNVNYKYEFDKYDNWIKKTSFKENKPDKFIIRKIKYK
ncbi:hypothetical protein [uncultured Winogradskyella sp.]|uniref:hypothetical protein n=1 Tax=uncultured Winogradskyella sp. TaxID=395353 RepID=UPI0026191104|nr:hypothetical protein [uncultured Winogradskyella sp.]